MSELVRDRAFEAMQGVEFSPPMQSKSIGGGAKTKANIGKIDEMAKTYCEPGKYGDTEIFFAVEGSEIII